MEAGARPRAGVLQPMPCRGLAPSPRSSSTHAHPHLPALTGRPRDHPPVRGRPLLPAGKGEREREGREGREAETARPPKCLANSLHPLSAATPLSTTHAPGPHRALSRHHAGPGHSLPGHPAGGKAGRGTLRVAEREMMKRALPHRRSHARSLSLSSIHRVSTSSPPASRALTCPGPDCGRA